MAKRTSVQVLCHPYFPAAPGLIWSRFKVLSNFTFKMCECPLMKSWGGRTNSLARIEGS